MSEPRVWTEVDKVDFNLFEDPELSLRKTTLITPTCEVWVYSFQPKKNPEE